MFNKKFLFRVNQFNPITKEVVGFFSFGYTVRPKCNNPKVNMEHLPNVNYQIIKGVSELISDFIPGDNRDIRCYYDDEQEEYIININQVCLIDLEVRSILDRLGRLLKNLMRRFEKQLNNPNTSRVSIVFNLLNGGHVTVYGINHLDDNGKYLEDIDENHSDNTVHYHIWDFNKCRHEGNISIDLKYYNHYYK